MDLHEVVIGSLDGRFKKKIILRKCPAICGEVPRIPSGPWIDELKKIHLSDWQLCHVDSPDIEILIGSDLWGQLVTSKPMKLTSGLTAVDTAFGWTLSGIVPGEREATVGMMSISTAMLNVDVNLQDLWNLEALGIMDPVDHKTRIEKDEETKKHFLRTVSKSEDGRYSVKLPWIGGMPNIPDNIKVAEARLLSATAKLQAANKYEIYDEIFRAWEKESFIEEVPMDPTALSHYLPHRPVFKPESVTAPVRPVFDASCKVGRKPSLNECLQKGPNLLELIPSIHLRFREKKIGVISDLRKPFQMINVAEEDRDFLRFLWWADPITKKLKAYRHRRVVFGVNCSPFLLGAVIEYHLKAMDEGRKAMADILLRSLYVDNCVTSVNNMQEYEDFKEVSIQMMLEAKMELRQWEVTSGEGSRVGCLARKECGLEHASQCPPQALTSVLGLIWNKDEDTLSVEVPKMDLPDKISKRTILSQIQKIFDPMGFLSPATIIPKVLLQKLWNMKKTWDENLNEEIRSEFAAWWRESADLEKIKLPRHAFGDRMTQHIQFHIFCDASQFAYAAAVYVRVEDRMGVRVQLLQAKSRVAPLKKITIPRLEWLGCLIAARLASSVKQALSMEPEETHFWSDSTTALAWIRGNDEWGTFVGNRVKEINSLTQTDNWKHVPGIKNPADLPSRGCSPSQLLLSKWWEGPTWQIYRTLAIA